jgi:hypothetical protein
MTGDYLQTVLKNAQAKTDKDGFSNLPEGSTMTLYVAHDGVGLTVNRVESVRVEGGFVEAKMRSGKREAFMLELKDLFAVSLEGAPGAPPKRAGFG